MKSKAIEDKIARIHISEQQKSLKPQEEQRAQDSEKVSASILLSLLRKCFHKVMYIILCCTIMFVKKKVIMKKGGPLDKHQCVAIKPTYC